MPHIINTDKELRNIIVSYKQKIISEIESLNIPEMYNLDIWFLLVHSNDETFKHEDDTETPMFSIKIFKRD